MGNYKDWRPVIVAKPLHVAALFSTSSDIDGGRKVAGLVACPSDHPLLKSSVEGARKILARPIQPKEPLPFSLVQKIA